jgi:hypothetical protein
MRISRSWSSAVLAGSCMVMALAACDGPVHGLGPGRTQIATSGGGGVAGSYELRSANGLSLPVLLTGSLGSDRVELTGGRIALSSDSTYSLTLNTRATAGTQQTPSAGTETGQYSIDGSVITFLATTGLQWSATLSDRSIQANVRYVPTGVSYSMVFTR